MEEKKGKTPFKTKKWVFSDLRFTLILLTVQLSVGSVFIPTDTSKECLTLSANLKLNVLCFTWSFDPAGLQQFHPRVKIKICFSPNSHEAGVLGYGSLG